MKIKIIKCKKQSRGTFHKLIKREFWSQLEKGGGVINKSKQKPNYRLNCKKIRGQN